MTTTTYPCETNKPAQCIEIYKCFGPTGKVDVCQKGSIVPRLYIEKLHVRKKIWITNKKYIFFLFSPNKKTKHN